MTPPRNRWWFLATFTPHSEPPAANISVSDTAGTRPHITASLARETEDRQYEGYPLGTTTVLSGSYELTDSSGLYDTSSSVLTGDIELRLDSGLLVAELPTVDYSRGLFFETLQDALDDVVDLERFVPNLTRFWDWVSEFAVEPSDVMVLTADGHVRAVSDLCSSVEKASIHWPIERVTVYPEGESAGGLDFHTDFHFRGLPTDDAPRALALQQFESHVRDTLTVSHTEV